MIIAITKRWHQLGESSPDGLKLNGTTTNTRIKFNESEISADSFLLPAHNNVVQSTSNYYSIDKAFNKPQLLMESSVRQPSGRFKIDTLGDDSDISRKKESSIDSQAMSKFAGPSSSSAPMSNSVLSGSKQSED